MTSQQGEVEGHGPARFDSVTAGLLADLAPVIVARLDAEGRITDVGGALLDTLGYSPDAFVGRHASVLAEDEATRHLVDRALAGEAAHGTLVREGRPWLAGIRPVVDDDGGPAGAVAVFTYADETHVQHELTAQGLLNQQFAAVIELSQDFIAIIDLDRTMIYLNRAGREMVGLVSEADALGRCVDDFLTPAGLQRIVDEEREFLLNGRWEGETSLRHFASGEEIPVLAQTFLVSRSEDGRPLAVASVRRDLRKERAAHDAMTVRMHEQRAFAELGRAALVLPLHDLMAEAVRLVAARYPHLSVAVLRHLSTTTTCQVVATNEAHLDSILVPVDDHSVSGHALRHNRLFATDDILADERFPLASVIHDFSMRAALTCPIPGEDGPWGLLGMARPEALTWTEDDVSFAESVTAILGAAVRRDELESRLLHQALHDHLTGLPNRALVMDRITQALNRSARLGSRVAVLLLDVDDFKGINDTLGHAHGDDLLAELASRLEGVVREGDTVARHGGDEFVVVCEDFEGDEEIARLAEAMQAACASGVEIEGRRLSLSASIGVAVAAGGRTSTTSILSEADIAMYRAKRERPGSYRIFDEAMRGEVVGRTNVANDLRAAVRAEALSVFYQPIVDLRTGRVVAMEALARWTDETGRAIPPDVFIPVAEETGMIGDVGRLVLRRTVADAARWRTVAAVGARVNASAYELRTPGYVDQVMSALADGGLDPACLGLEITESAFVDEDPISQRNLTGLRDAGVSLLIDDFGTGYSSLSYLQRFPIVDVLKVDRSFLGAGTRGEAVVKAVVGLGRAFGLQVCAEGVETVEQYSRVEELGCDYAQGYLLSRPLPVADAQKLLTTWQPQSAGRLVPPIR